MRRAVFQIGVGVAMACAVGLVVPSSAFADPPDRFTLSGVGIYNFGENGNLDLVSEYHDDGSQTSVTLTNQTFTGLDGNNVTRTTTFNGSNQARAEFGRLHLYASGTVFNNYYNAANPKAEDGGVLHPEGSPDGYYSLGFAVFNDILHFGGSLQAGYKARYIFFAEGDNIGEGSVADLGVGIAGNPDESFFAFEPGPVATYWVTQSYNIDGITPQSIHVQFSNQFTANCNDHPDGATISGTSDFSSTLTLVAIQVVNAQGNPVGGVTVTSDSETVYPLSGDVNLDGVVNGRDIQAFVRLLGSATPSPAFFAADLNADGIIDAADATLLAGMLVAG